MAVASLGREVHEVQNPALGALLQWRFVVGYSGARRDAAACPIVLVFLVLPILFHSETLAYVQTTQLRSGLRAFAGKFAAGPNNESDMLLLLHDRALLLRHLSLDALRAAVAAQLVTVDFTAGTAFSLTKTAPKAGLAEGIRSLVRNAEKLGQWSGVLSLAEVSSILHVRF